MNHLRLFIFSLLAVISGGLVSSCISDDFTTSPSDLLTFSSDTVSFDTVFTDLGTPTARLKVFNPSKKSINISSIQFASSESFFRMNVDGVSGSRFEDVEIRGNDSIFIFIECYLPENDKNEPFLVEDRLLFLTNGVTQNVLVEAYGQNVTRLRGVTLTQDMTLTSERPYVVFDSLTVEKGATLNLEPGTNLMFHDKAKLTVRGRINAVGMPGRMINLRGDRLDDVLPDVGYDILAGQWEGMYIDAESFDNRLEYVDMRSTSVGLVVDSCGTTDRSKLLLVNSWLHNSQSSTLSSSYAKVDAYGCVFSEAAGAVVSLTGGDHDFRQCTLANYYLFSAVSQPLLCLYHCLPAHMEEDGNYQPLMAAQFLNCILYGLPADINEGDLTGSNVFLKNCSLKSAGEDDFNFIDCLWDCDPLFLTVREDYYFNYHVQEGSPAIGAGNPAFVTSLCALDMDGVNRLAFGSPTLGAFAFVPQ